MYFFIFDDFDMLFFHKKTESHHQGNHQQYYNGDYRKMVRNELLSCKFESQSICFAIISYFCNFLSFTIVFFWKICFCETAVSKLHIIVLLNNFNPAGFCFRVIALFGELKQFFYFSAIIIYLKNSHSVVLTVTHQYVFTV